MDWILQNFIKRFPRFMTFLIIAMISWVYSCVRGGTSFVKDEASDLSYKPNPKPNIIVIMVDDMGYSDIGCYGGEIHTPNLDKLAENGLRFTQFYNTARCCPTRASLMTGLYPHQAGVGQMTFDRNKPGYRGTLTPNTVTIAEVLREADYHTAMVGKWHLSLTKNTPQNASWVSHRIDLGLFSDTLTYPVYRGFEEHYGTIWGVVDYFDPFSLVHNTKPIESVPKDYYYTDALTNYAIQFIEKYSKDGDPFFLYVAYTAPHWPLHALQEDIEKYKDTYKVGWDKIREKRYKRMVDMGLIKADKAVLSTRYKKEKRWTDNPTKEWDALAMAVHAAMIDRVDQGIGRIIAELEMLKLLDNTLILFLSDNGASPEEPSKYGPGFDRPSHTRSGTEIVYAVDKDVLPGPQTTYSGIGPMWANASNTPFRYWKKESYEGGVCTPLIVHWPRGITVESGAITHQPGHVIDIMATCIDVAGAEYPITYKDREITPLEGKSLTPIFHGKQRPDHKVIFFEHFGGRGLRQGNWKIVALRGKPWELYNLSEDRTEMNNLASQYSDKLEQLKALWEEWAWHLQVFPLPENE